MNAIYGAETSITHTQKVITILTEKERMNPIPDKTNRKKNYTIMIIPSPLMLVTSAPSGN